MQLKVILSSRREEGGQTDDISASFSDSRSHSSDFDQSPQSGSYSLSLRVLILITSHILLTLCSVGLSLCLQSRFLYTFDNQIIYVIKKETKRYIFTCKLQDLELVCEWSGCEFLHVGFLGCFSLRNVFYLPCFILW